MNRVVACAALLIGCEPQLGQTAQPIVGGSLDPGEPAVVAIVARRLRCEEAAPPVACTGTLIAPRVVLTAAHCVLPGAGPGTLEVYIGDRVGATDGAFIAVDDAVRHPAFDDATHANDLALLRLATPAAVSPAALPAVALDASAVGAAARVVGYGVTATGAIPDGNRRQGTMTVGAVAALTFDTEVAPASSCGGDSGGPVFVTIGGAPQLLGVTVSGDAACATHAINARIDVALADFIQPYVAAPPPSEGAIALDAVCSSPCDSAADCPAALACMPDDRGIGRCQIAANPAGDLTAACATDGQCESRLCARVGADDCRCHVACDSLGHSGSCATSDGSWLAALGIIALGRRRSTRRTPAASTRAPACPGPAPRSDPRRAS